MADRVPEAFKARRCAIADAPDGWLTAPQPGAVFLVDGIKADALPAPPEPAALLHAGPERWLMVSETATPKELLGHLALPRKTMITDLSHARVRIRLSGPRGREALQSGLAIDLHQAACPVGYSTPTAFRGVAVMLHVVQPETFDLYVLRSYAISLREWLEDAGASAALS